MKLFRSAILLFILTFILTSIAFAQNNEGNVKSEVTGKKVDDGMVYGNDLSSDIQTIALSDLLAKPQDYEGKTVKLTGTVTDVCQMMGCWLMLSDGTNEIRVTTLHKFFMPKDCTKSKAVVDGTFKLTEITEEHAKKMIEESQNSKIKAEDIKGTQKAYTIEATGVKILSE
jgi:hypothetical protein